MVAHKVREIDTHELREAIRRAGERAVKDLRIEELAPGEREVLGFDARSPRQGTCGVTDPVDASEKETTERWVDLDLSELRDERAR